MRIDIVAGAAQSAARFVGQPHRAAVSSHATRKATRRAVVMKYAFLFVAAAQAYNASTPPTRKTSNCTLQRFPAIYASRVHFFSFVAADLYHLLGHALRYYRHLGLDLKNQGRVVVHNASGLVALEKTLVYLRRYEISHAVSNEWSSQTKREAANAFLLRLPDGAWLVYPDLDEFFAFPCEVAEIMDRGGLLSGSMVDRVAFDWRLNSLKPLPRASKMTNTSSIAHQYPRTCRLTGGLLDTNAHKYTLVPAVDASGQRLRYINAHSVACGSRRVLRHTHAQRANNCAGVTVYRGPDVAHYGFTKITIPVLERKLATYRQLARVSGEVRHRDAVEHYRKLRASFEYCPRTKSHQFTLRARKLAQKRYCDPLPVRVARAYAPPSFCFEPTKAPTPRPRASTKKKTTPRALERRADDDPPDDRSI